MIRCGAHVIHALHTLSTLYKLDFLLRFHTLTVFFCVGFVQKQLLFTSFCLFLFKEIPPHFCCERSERG